MIWTNIVKNYLSAISTKDIDFLKENLDDSVCVSYNNTEYKNKSNTIQFIIDLLSQIDEISIKILNIAYHNKLFFVEYEMLYRYTDFSKYRQSKKCIDVIEIGNSGKIISITNYKR